MDSVNPLESQSSPLNFRSTASNTTSFRCPCGGFNECAQALFQAYCFRPPNLGQSQCKHTQDAEEKFPMQQHFYPSIPFVSPFFYSSPLTNLYCPHNPPPETPAKEQQSAQDPGHVFHQTENSFRANNGTSEEETPKNSNPLDSEPQFFCHPWCYANANGPGTRRTESGFQRCGCGDSIPWTCSSFIVPMITYCVIWNSRKSNVNPPSGSSPEACPQNKAGSEPDTSTDIPPANQANDFSNNPTEIVDERLVVEEVTSAEWRNQEGIVDLDQVTTRSFKSLTSSFDKESGYDNTEENSEKNEIHLEVGSDDSEEDEDDDEGEEDGETDDWADEDKNDQEETTTIYFSNETQSYIKPFDSQPPSAPGSYTDLKQLEKNKAPATGVSCTEMKVSPPGSPKEAFRSRITNHSVQEKFDPQKTRVRRDMCIKKFINNFTMTDQTNRVQEEGQTTAAAAGDLGGVNCVGYRINVSNCFNDRDFEILKGNQTLENSKTNEIYVKDLSHPEEGINNSSKISDKTTKNVRHFRSGIAKLLISPKLKDAKADQVKNTKTDSREQVQRELAAAKRKHSCFPPDTAVGTNDYSKAQKMKNNRPTQGPEKHHQQQQQKTRSGITETPRKEEKNSRVKTFKDAAKK